MSVVGVVISVSVALFTVFSILILGFSISRRKSSKVDFNHNRQMNFNSTSENFSGSYESKNGLIVFERPQLQFLQYHGNNNSDLRTVENNRDYDGYSQYDNYRFFGVQTNPPNTTQIDESFPNREITIQFR